MCSESGNASLDHLTQVFVYGTLKPSEVNAGVWRGQAEFMQPAIVVGQLYALPLGYPALIPGTQCVEGFLLSFREATILSVLDEFEQHNPVDFARQYPDLVLEENAYTRAAIAVCGLDRRSLGQAWVYQMSLEQVKRLQGICLAEGRWSQQIQQLAFEPTTESC